MGYLVVGFEQQHGIDAVSRELWIVWRAEDRFYVPQVLFFRALGNELNGFGVDIYSVNHARVGNAVGSANREPTRSGSDVSHILTGLNAKHIHHPVDLKLLIALRVIKNRRKIASIRRAGRPIVSLPLRSRRWRTGLCGSSLRRPQNCQQ